MKSPIQVNPADYHTKLTCNREDVLAADSWLSKSVLWEFLKVSPWRWRFHPKQLAMTEAIIWGTVIDALTTAPECFNDQVAVIPQDAPQRPTSIQLGNREKYLATIDAIKWWDDWESKLPVLPDDAPKKPTAAQRKSAKPKPETAEAIKWWDEWEAKQPVLPEDAPEKPSAAQRNGVESNKETIKAIEWWDEWDQGAEGKAVISFELMQQAHVAAEMLQETHKQSAEIFSASDSQVVIGAKLQGMKVKGLVDLAPKGANFLADLKTTSTHQFNRAGFEKTTGRLGYHMQCGLYLGLWNACFPDDQRDEFKIIWQEREAPHEVCITEIPRFEIEQGMESASAAIQKLKHCAENDHWPMLGEDTPIQTVRPTWASIQEEQERGQA